MAWSAVVDAGLRRSALATVAAVAERLRDPEQVAEMARQATIESGVVIDGEWTPIPVLPDYSGLAVLFSQLDLCFPGEGWDRVAHTYLVRATRPLESASTKFSLGLFGGLAEFCFMAYQLSRGGARYQRLLSSLEGILYQRVGEIAMLPTRAKGGVTSAEYDLIQGPTGIGAYLLLRSDNAIARAALETILGKLLFLTEGQASHLRFFSPPEMQATEAHRERYPHGATDCGLAHGVPGPLALLALARCAGVMDLESKTGIKCLAEWLVRHQTVDAWGITWPYAVPPDGIEPPDKVARAAWCYGSPGIARALWLAGRSLKDYPVQEVAISAMRAVRSRPIPERGISGPILCHGVAGLLQVTLRFANDTRDAFFVDMSDELTRELLDLFEPDSLAGFRDSKPDGRRVNNPGFLEGAAGIALALLAAATDVEPTWDRKLLLA